MAYITYADFVKVYGYELLDNTQFNSLVTVSCNKIDQLTRFNIKKIGFSNLPVFIQECIKYACCSQVAYFNNYGVDVSYTGVAGQGFTVGKVSVDNTRINSTTAGRNYDSVSPEAVSWLEQTGLMNRDVGVYSDPFLGGYLPIL